MLRPVAPTPAEGKRGAGPEQSIVAGDQVRHGAARLLPFLRTCPYGCVNPGTPPGSAPGPVACLRSGTPRGPGGHAGRRACRKSPQQRGMPGPLIEVGRLCREPPSPHISPVLARQLSDCGYRRATVAHVLLKRGRGDLGRHRPGQGAEGKDSWLHPSLSGAPILSPCSGFPTSGLSSAGGGGGGGVVASQETQPFAGSPAGTQAEGAGLPCLAVGFSPLARPKTSFLRLLALDKGNAGRREWRPPRGSLRQG